MAKKLLKIVDTKNKTIKDGFKEFYLYCRVKNLSPKSLDYYEYAYFRFAKVYNEKMLVKDITKREIDLYILALKDENVGEISINTFLRGIRVIINYWISLDYLEKFKIDLIKTTKPIKDTYTPQEIQKLLKKPNLKSCNYAEYRDWVIINMLLSSGMRATTLCNLKIKDIDLDNMCMLYTTTKGRRQQIVPISTTLLKILDEYIKIRLSQTSGNTDIWLFVSAFGAKLNSDSLNHTLRNYNRNRGIMRTGVHKWRHTFSKIYIQSKGSPFMLQKILQHKDLRMTREYVNLFDSDLQKDFNEFNPLEIMSKENNKRVNYLKLR